MAIRFDLGRYHATPWGSHVNDGLVEWPPGPWRVLRALYAVARTNVRLTTRVGDVDRALVKLAQAPPPRYVLPPVAVAHTRHYVPSRLYSPTAPGETDRIIDAFAAVDSEADIEVWWEAALDAEELTALGEAVTSLGYLGRSESVCSSRMLTRMPTESFDAVPLELTDAGGYPHTLPLLCPRGDDPLAALATSIGDMRRRRMTQPIGARFVDYAVNRPSPPTRQRVCRDQPTLACFRLHGRARPALHDAVTICSLLRSALQRRFHLARPGGKSPVFSGHEPKGPRRDQHMHAHFIALPGEDGRRVEHLVVWAPEGFGEAEVESLASLQELHMSDLAEPLRVALTALGRDDEIKPSDKDSALSALLGPSTRWRSLTPFALPRHPKRRGGRTVETPEEQIRREWTLRNPARSGLLRDVRLLPPGRWLAFRRTRSGTSRLAAPHVVGAELRFAEPVRGPLALGALSHFGLGLFEAA